MIRLTNEINVEDYNALRESVGWKVLDSQQAQRGLDGSVRVVAAMDGDITVASARIVGDMGYMYLIADVMVHPDYQGQGIGKMMITDLNSWLDDLGKDGNTVMVNLMATVGNEEFYRRLGFTARPNDHMGAGMVRWING